MSTTPAASTWLTAFQQTFDETVIYPGFGTHLSTGAYYYDVSDPKNMLTRIDRDNGRWDRYCGLTHHLKNQPCS